MTGFEFEMHRRVCSLKEQGLYRELRRVDSPQSPRIQLEGQSLLNMSSNDYLGLANHPALKETAIRAIERYGAGAGASRLICGSLKPHHDLEEALAQFKRTEAALAFSTGYAAAVGTITALVGPDDVMILDKLVHASIVDAARLSGAKLRIFRHNDLSALEDLLQWSTRQREMPRPAGGQTRRRVLIVTESMFSMDGDHAPLREIVGLKNKYNAWLMVDEAHATGLYGADGRGLSDEVGVANEIEIQMGTLGKALGAAGGYITGSRTLIDCLINRARSFIFSTAPVPAAAAAATAGIQLAQSELGEARRKDLWRLVALLPPAFAAPGAKRPSVIVPVHIGDETKAVEAATTLRQRAIFVPAVRYPTVARGRARLRVTLTAAHTPADLEQLISGLAGLLPKTGSPSPGR